MKRITPLFFLLMAAFSISAQVEADKKIQLTGSGSDAKVEGIEEVVNDTDAANKKYVDDAIAPLQTAITNLENAAPCNLGDIGPGGGRVFYCGAPMKLEAATVSLGNAPWGCSGTPIGGTSTVFQTGQANSNLILAGCPTAGIAARLCDEWVSGGKSDWYLPSKDDFTLMYVNRIVIGGLPAGDFWTSSEFDSAEAWRTDTANGVQVYVTKSASQTVRCIRSF